jgi:hypothetical protein
VTSRPLENLRSLSRDFDLFDPPDRDWTALLAAGLAPPLAVSGGALVWGFALLAAAERARIAELACVELAPAGREAMLAIALHLENRAGAYSLPEQGRLYAFLTVSGDADRLRESRDLVALITPEKPDTWLKEMAHYRALPDQLKHMAVGRLLDVKTAYRVKSLPAEFFFRLGQDKHRFSFSERRQFALFLQEIACRDGLDEAGILDLAGMLLDQADPLAEARARRFPEYTGLLSRFFEITASLEGAGVRVLPPEGFEGEEFTFGFSVTSRAVFERKLAALKNFEDQVDRLFDLL